MIRIERLDDPRISAYRNLPDRTLRGEHIFIAEGSVVVEWMLGSRYQAESLLVAEEYAEMFAERAVDCPVYVGSVDLLKQVVGFNFHMGAMAIGRRRPNLPLDDLIATTGEGPACLAVCPAVTKPENLGLVFRSAAAFGLTGILLGRRTCDPLSRRCVRVSMGAVLEVSFVRSDDIAADLNALRHVGRFERIAAVLDSEAEPLDTLDPAPRTAWVFGNEFDGLTV